MPRVLLRLWHSYGFALPWIALACALLVLAFAVKSYTEALGKAYAIVGTILAAVPFFRESRLKRARDHLTKVKGETPEDQEVLDFTRGTLEAALSLFQPDAVRWVRAALVFAGSSFVVDLVETMTK